MELDKFIERNRKGKLKKDFKSDFNFVKEGTLVTYGKIRKSKQFMITTLERFHPTDEWKLVVEDEDKLKEWV